MTKTPPRGFPKSEFQARTQAAQTQMAAEELDGILLTTEPEIRYFSGFYTAFWQSPTRPWFLFVPATGDPIAIIPAIGADLMKATWISDIRTWDAPNPGDDGISLLTDLLSPLRKIGIPMGHETHIRMPLSDYQCLFSNLPNITTSDATPIIRKLRMVKSPAEIEKITHICGIISQTFDRLPEFIHVNQPLEQVFREFRREALRLGADDIPYLVGGAGPGGYRDVISPPTEKPLQNNDLLMLDTGATWDGYFCDFDRNFAIGPPGEEVRRAHETLWQATEKGMDAARPGATCAEVFNYINQYLNGNQPTTANVGRMGHGLGMQLTEWPSIAPWDHTVLEENMVLTLEPSLNLADGLMMVHEENILITSGAPKLLTRRTPRDLPVIR